ncbi:MAG: hypothetical protein JO253_00100 [Alphaproteobacteria bacterium]|nr:hypothetical protein [Alphaproteobacteria bacterium]
MLQVNPVLADTAATTQTASNINAASVDSRRYTKFDRTASEVQTDENFTFSDLLDTLNPLEHIPVISSAYRAIAGEDIHPAARVAGDILYGGVGGVASGVLALAGSTGDSLMESQTGHDATGHIVLAMLGDDEGAQKPQETPVMVADTDAAAQQAVQQAPQQPEIQQSIKLAQANGAITPSIPATAASVSAPVFALNNQATLKPLRADKSFPLPDRTDSAHAFPLNPNKLPYGGVIAPVRTASNVPAQSRTPVATAIERLNATIKQQDRMIALVQNGHDMRTSSTVETNPAMPGAHPIVNTPAQPVITPNAAAGTSTNTSSPTIATTTAPDTQTASTMAQTTVNTAGGTARTWGQDNYMLPNGFSNDALLLKALGQYQNTISRSATSGNRVDLVN